MNIPTLVRYGRLYLRSEMLVAEIRLKLFAQKAGLVAFGLCVALFGVGMLNVAAFQGLALAWGAVPTALALSGADFLLALIAIVLALTRKPGVDLKAAEELRQAALSTIEGEVGGIQSGATGLGLFSGAAEATTARLLVTAVAALVRSLRNRSGEAGKTSTPAA